MLSVTTITHVRANEPLCISYIDLYKSIESSLPITHAAHTLARTDSYATKARMHARTPSAEPQAISQLSCTSHVAHHALCALRRFAVGKQVFAQSISSIAAASAARVLHRFRRPIPSWRIRTSAQPERARSFSSCTASSFAASSTSQHSTASCTGHSTL